MIDKRTLDVVRHKADANARLCDSGEGPCDSCRSLVDRVRRVTGGEDLEALIGRYGTLRDALRKAGLLAG